MSAADIDVRVDRPPFAMIPEALLYDGSLSPNAVRIYGCLLRHGDDPKSCFPSHERIAKLLGMSERSVARPLAELESAGWITKVKRDRLADGTRRPDAYHLHARPRAELRATTAQSSAEPSRNPASNHRAAERGEREPLNESKKNEIRKARASARPQAWEPNAAHRAKADEHGIDLDHEAEQFQSFHDAKGSRFVDWDAAFHTWLGNARKWARTSTGRQSFFSEDFTQAAIDRVFGRGA